MLNLSDSLTCQKQNKYGEGAFLVYRRRWRTKFTAETEKVHHMHHSKQGEMLSMKHIVILKISIPAR